MWFLDNQKPQLVVTFLLVFLIFHLNFQRTSGFYSLNTANHGRPSLNAREQRATNHVVLGASSSGKGVITLEREDDEQRDPPQPLVYQNVVTEVENIEETGNIEETDPFCLLDDVSIQDNDKNRPDSGLNTMDVKIRKTEKTVGLSLDMDGKGIFVYFIEDYALPEVLNQLKIGDRVLSVNGVSYNTGGRMAEAIREIKLGETIKFLIQRDDPEIALPNLGEDSKSSMISKSTTSTVLEGKLNEAKSPVEDLKSSMNSKPTTSVVSEGKLDEATILDLQTREILQSTMDVKIRKTEKTVGLSLDMDGKGIFVYFIEDYALPEVLNQLKIGDRVLSVNGVPYDTSDRMAEAIREIKVGETINFLIQRDDPEIALPSLGEDSKSSMISKSTTSTVLEGKLNEAKSPVEDLKSSMNSKPTTSVVSEEKLDEATILDLRTREILQSASKGQIRKREAVKAAYLRLKRKTRSALKTKILTETETKDDTEADLRSMVMEGGWKKRGKSLAVVRTAEIWLFALKFGVKEAKLKKIEDKEELSARRTENAAFLNEGLLRLGPTFIKLGQLLSTRVDILPKEYISELASLQDNVPGFPGKLAIKIIEEDFGKPITELFDTFDETPLAAASLGQVHVATKDGKKFAVKVQRQGLKELFDVDLQNLKLLAKILDAADPKFDGADRDWVSIYEESAKLLYREIDYKLEAENAQRFKENFANVDWVKVPDIYWDLVSTRVVTMEFVPGIKINDIAEIERRGIDRDLLAKRSAECYLSQLCRNGFFHCDPHPGNVACDEQFGGRLIYYDFGMMDEFKPNVKSGLVNLIFGVYENDAKETCDALEEMGILRPGSDRVSVERIARSFLEEFSGTINQKDGQWVQELDKEQAKEIRKQRRLQLGQDLLTVGNDVPFKFPPTFTFVFRAFTSLDGIGKGLDPKYDLTRLAQPYLKELIDLRDGSLANSLVKSWGKKLGLRPVDIAAVVKEPRNVAYLEETVRKMEQGDLKLRVRVLESERAFARLDVVQKNMSNMVLASALLNAGLILRSSSPSGQLSLAAKAALTLAGVLGVQVSLGALELKKIDKQNKQYGVTK